MGLKLKSKRLAYSKPKIFLTSVEDCLNDFDF